MENKFFRNFIIFFLFIILIFISISIFVIVDMAGKKISLYMLFIAIPLYAILTYYIEKLRSYKENEKSIRDNLIKVIVSYSLFLFFILHIKYTIEFFFGKLDSVGVFVYSYVILVILKSITLYFIIEVSIKLTKYYKFLFFLIFVIIFLFLSSPRFFSTFLSLNFMKFILLIGFIGILLIYKSMLTKEENKIKNKTMKNGNI